jgi:hypothetical protein
MKSFNFTALFSMMNRLTSDICLALFLMSIKTGVSRLLPTPAIRHNQGRGAGAVHKAVTRLVQFSVMLITGVGQLRSYRSIENGEQPLAYTYINNGSKVEC